MEAQAWARDEASIGEGRQYQEAVEAACQTTTPDEPLRGPLVRNCDASRKGVVGRFEVTHLIVPSSLQPVGASPQAFCGWPFALGSATLCFDGRLGTGELCEKCLLKLASRAAWRRAATARAVAASLGPEPEADPAEVSA